MAKKNKGYIPLWRDIQDHWIWANDEPFSKGQAWVDLLLSVNHEEKKILINGHLQIIKAGQKWTSYRTLARQWNWSKDRVKRYIKLLKSDGMIYTDETPNGTLLTVLNWDSFRIQRDTNKYTNEDTDKDDRKDTSKDTGKDETIMINNDKECIRIKKKEPPAQLPIEPPTGGGEWE